MAKIDVLPAALVAAARRVRHAAPDAHVPAADLGQPALTAALDGWLAAWSCAPLVAAVEETAGSVEASASAYADVESLLLPRALR